MWGKYRYTILTLIFIIVVIVIAFILILIFIMIITILTTVNFPTTIIHISKKYFVEEKSYKDYCHYHYNYHHYCSYNCKHPMLNYTFSKKKYFCGENHIKNIIIIIIIIIVIIIAVTAIVIIPILAIVIVIIHITDTNFLIQFNPIL